MAEDLVSVVRELVLNSSLPESSRARVTEILDRLEAPTPPATQAAQAHAEKLGVDLSQVEGSGKEGTVTKADVEAAASEDAQPAPPWQQ